MSLSLQFYSVPGKGGANPKLYSRCFVTAVQEVFKDHPHFKCGVHFINRKAENSKPVIDILTETISDTKAFTTPVPRISSMSQHRAQTGGTKSRSARNGEVNNMSKSWYDSTHGFDDLNDKTRTKKTTRPFKSDSDDSTHRTESWHSHLDDADDDTGDHIEPAAEKASGNLLIIDSTSFDEEGTDPQNKAKDEVRFVVNELQTEIVCALFCRMSEQWHLVYFKQTSDFNPINIKVLVSSISRNSNELFTCSFFLAFDFCRFCVVIRFFHPRHNGQ